MTKIQSSRSSNRKSRRTGTIASVLAFSVAALAVSGVSYGAKPATPTALSAPVCSGIGGVWSANTCTIEEATSSLVSSGFKIYNGVVLDIKGSLTINPGVTIANAGTIIVENAGGVIPPNNPLHEWETGLLVYGTLDNSGAITIKNVYDEANGKGTEGITVSDAVSVADWTDLSTFVVVPGALTNSGTITIRNVGPTRGIENLGTLTNSASGIISVENSGITSVGIYNRRASLSGKQFYINGTMTNAGSITIASSGESADSADGRQYGYGIYNVGLFTNSAPGTFTISPSPFADDARGLYNAGSFTNFGTFTNDRGSYIEGDIVTSTWGSYNAAGAMISYGTTSAKGTFFNSYIMLNYGKITSQGVFYDETINAMLNYGTFYNYGLIVGGTNKGICIDEVGSYGGC